ncbi:ribosomal protection-like ABC-F family protein [Sedimentibacter sp. MB31-C6]|uniref:ribosomal protection-like ABC-F family protein n=1 Tax=Sedimentibacter sp. MB31-C6 TaxID=3109366 RepID=UPI002DDCE681|nr:ABC-F family ATP-binding cassette domain-containing protein [Sedimentibacter sp. MB36-C1]WSI04015.1 ABC-F family ATP-binding cassette domain-containing protein [Sedimentibacter sp. MB36-C1]
MIELSINNLTKYYAANKIFQNITFDIKTCERVGLIGQNGSGKTTIMKILMGLENYQEGEINLRKDAKLGYLDQIPVFDDEIKTIDVLEMAFKKTIHIRKQMKELEEKFKNLKDDALEKAMTDYGKLSDEFELLGGYDSETKINKVTSGLQIDDTLKNMNYNKLSGGEKTRVMLAKILLEEPDILLLDEPTNHLDLETIEWLEDFLKNYKGTVIVISHDRYFLDSVVNKIIELEFDKSNIYLGNYSYYVAEKERRFLIDLQSYKNQQKKIDQMERQIERYRIWGEMRDSNKMFKRAKELEKRLDKVEVKNKPVLNNRKIRLNQINTNRSGKIVVETKDVCKAFAGKVLIQNANLSIFYQDSCCIIGRNGSGKTTLLKMILGDLEPDKGNIRIGSQIKIGYLPQNIIFEDEELTILEYFSYLHNISYGLARAQLAKVLFLKEDVNKKIKVLSGGEKSRLKLCSLTFEGANLMVLDEPTNHLDIDSREVLEETLMEFEGTLLFVSHDRYFINKLANKIISINNKRVKLYNGDYTYYLDEFRKLMDKKEENNLKDNMKSKKQYKNKENSKKNFNNSESSSNLKRKLEQLEKEINELEEKIKTIEEAMNLYSRDANKLCELLEEKEELNKKLELIFEKWENLSMKIPSNFHD